jgi:hypothetical protein
MGHEATYSREVTDQSPPTPVVFRTFETAGGASASSPELDEERRSLAFARAVAVFAVILLDLALAFTAEGKHAWWSVFADLALGPFEAYAGYWKQYHHVCNETWIHVLTGGNVALLVWNVFSIGRVSVTLAALFWLLWGYYFTIGMWI